MNIPYLFILTDQENMIQYDCYTHIMPVLHKQKAVKVCTKSENIFSGETKIDLLQGGKTKQNKTKISKMVLALVSLEVIFLKKQTNKKTTTTTTTKTTTTTTSK